MEKTLVWSRKVYMKTYWWLEVWREFIAKKTISPAIFSRLSQAQDANKDGLCDKENPKELLFLWLFRGGFSRAKVRDPTRRNQKNTRDTIEIDVFYVFLSF